MLYHRRDTRPIIVTMDELTAAIAATLRAERAAAQLTQHQLADKSGLGYQTVMRLEKCERSPSVGQLAALCSVFGIPMSELVERAERRIAR